MKIILLAAGEDRNFPGAVPKPLIPVRGKSMVTRTIEKIFEVVPEREIVIVINEKHKELFQTAVGTAEAVYVNQGLRLGTAHALKCALEAIDPAGELLVMYADTVLIREASIAGLISAHRIRKDSLTVLSGLTRHVYPYSLVRRDENQKVLRLECGTESELKKPFEYFLGPLLARGEAVASALDRLEASAAGRYQIPDLINEVIATGGTVSCFRSLDESEYLGVNTPQDLSKAEEILAMREIENLQIRQERHISFGTGGWRARIGRGFTSRNVRKVIHGIATYLAENGLARRGVVLGYDNRFLSEDFSRLAAEVFSANNIKVYFSRHSSPTPLITYTVLKKGAGGGVILTASHNPPDYNGIKFETFQGLPAPLEVTDRVQNLANGTPSELIPWVSFEKAVKNDYIVVEDFRNDYLDYIEAKINISAIRKVNPRVCFDPMYGSGTSTLQMALIGARCDLVTIHSRKDPLFGGKSPAPSEESLASLIQFMKENTFDIGIAVDGDADRIALVDELGNYISANEIIPLVYYYLHEVKGLKGGAVRNVSTSHNIDLLCEVFDEKCYEVPVGFKYIAAAMQKHSLLLGGESSGGVTFKGHIMEKDGIFTAMLILEALVLTGKRLSELLALTHKIAGKVYRQEEEDFYLTPSIKVNIEKFMAGELESVLGMPVIRLDRTDGLKIYLSNDSWCLLRLSGTEPLLRVVAESREREFALELIKWIKESILR